MQQMKHGNTKFTGTPQLTPFPIGSNSTPGLIANSLFQIYTPVYGEKSANIETKEVKTVDETKVKDQKGFGDTQEKLAISEPLKRKLDNNIFQKMLHPTFKVSKLEPKMKKEKMPIAQKTGNGSATLLIETKQEKKFHKF